MSYMDREYIDMQLQSVLLIGHDTDDRARSVGSISSL